MGAFTWLRKGAHKFYSESFKRTRYAASRNLTTLCHLTLFLLGEKKSFETPPSPLTVSADVEVVRQPGEWTLREEDKCDMKLWWSCSALWIPTVRTGDSSRTRPRAELPPGTNGICFYCVSLRKVEPSRFGELFLLQSRRSPSLLYVMVKAGYSCASHKTVSMDTLAQWDAGFPAEVPQSCGETPLLEFWA